MSSKILKRPVRRGRRRVYKKLSKKEIEDRRQNETCGKNNFIRAGNEGQIHMSGKIDIAVCLWNKYKDQFDKSNKGDGVWFEYPIMCDQGEYSLYQKRKLNYLLSLYQKIRIEEVDDVEIKNLHNIFNSNLKSALRGRKSISSLDIKKIVDIAVVADGKIVHVVEVVSKNKLTSLQRQSLEDKAKYGGFLFEEIQL
jgi:hypothetical protein